MSLLEVDKINSYYGDSHILFDVSMRVEENEVVALLGRNGAGKSTTLKTLMGVVRAKGGTIRHKGVEVQHMAPHELDAALGQLVRSHMLHLDPLMAYDAAFGLHHPHQGFQGCALARAVTAQ